MSVCFGLFVLCCWLLVVFALEFRCKMRLTQVFLSKIPKKYHYSNFPERFIKKQTEFIEWKTPRQPNYQPRTLRYRKYAYYDMHRPWASEFQEQNSPNHKHPNLFVQPMARWNWFVGDIVQVLRGKDKGKKGVISFLVEDRNWVFVKNLNLKHKHQEETQKFPGMVNSMEYPLVVPRDVCLVDPEDNQPTEVEWRFDEDGNEVRVSTRTGRIIPIPQKALETRDYTHHSMYKEQPKDTRADEVTKVTFTPTIKTFEMDIMDKKGIKEDRIPYSMYWY